MARIQYSQRRRATSKLAKLCIMSMVSFLSYSLPAALMVAAQAQEVPEATSASSPIDKRHDERRSPKGAEDSNAQDDAEERLLRRMQGNNKKERTGTMEKRLRVSGQRGEAKEQRNRNSNVRSQKKMKQRGNVAGDNKKQRTVPTAHYDGVGDATKKRVQHRGANKTNQQRTDNRQKQRTVNNYEERNIGEGGGKRGSKYRGGRGQYGGSRKSNNGGDNAYNYCGTSFANANSQCNVPCPNGVDSDCPRGETCFADVEECPPIGNGSGNGDSAYNYCGTSFANANSQCNVPCPNGVDSDCPRAETCFADVVECSPSEGNGPGNGGKNNNDWYGGSNGWYGSEPPQKTGQGFKPIIGYYPSFDDKICVQDEKYPNYMRTNFDFYFSITINQCCRLHYKGDVKSCINESMDYAKLNTEWGHDGWGGWGHDGWKAPPVWYQGKPITIVPGPWGDDEWHQNNGLDHDGWDAPWGNDGWHHVGGKGKASKTGGGSGKGWQGPPGWEGSGGWQAPPAWDGGGKAGKSWGKAVGWSHGSLTSTDIPTPYPSPTAPKDDDGTPFPTYKEQGDK